MNENYRYALIQQVIFFSIILVFYYFSSVFSASNEKQFAATDTSTIAEITAEEQQFYQSDFLPLSLAEKGRQSVTAWRGMPPGFLQYEFQGIQIYQPLWGFWDNQLVPIEIIHRRQIDLGRLVYRFLPLQPRPIAKPVSRVVFSQDFVFGLSYLDAGLTEFYRPGSFFRIGGNNFLRDGFSPEYTSVHVNTYRFQLHHQLSSRWTFDFWYLQLRHKFRLGKYPFFDFPQRVHRVGQLTWIKTKFQPDSTFNISLTPYIYIWGDRYHTQLYKEHRKVEMYSLGLNLTSVKKYQTGNLTLSLEGVQHHIRQALHLKTDAQFEGNINIQLQHNWKKFWLSVGSKYSYQQKVGSMPGLYLETGWNNFKDQVIQMGLTYQPSNLAMAALFWQDDSITSLSNAKVPIRQGVNLLFKIPVFRRFKFTIEPFYYRYRNALNFSKTSSSFIQSHFVNFGVTTQLSGRFGPITIHNELTFNQNYKNVYAPQFNNILKANLPITLFNQALKLNGFLIYHLVCNWQELDYFPLVNQYVFANWKNNTFHILDFKILAHVKKATLFFVWENSLSQDYQFVRGYTEFFRIFRIGIYWTFFD